MRYHMHNAQILAFCLAVYALASACATVTEIGQRTDVRMIPDVPFYPQEEYQCGPASLASVLNYWDANVSPDEVAEEIFSTSARGTLTIDMILYAQKKGFYAEQFRGSMEKVRESLNSGYPLIVLVDYGFSVIEVNHFMVLNGYAEGGVIAHVGKTPNAFLQEKDFLTAWKKTGYWTLLIRKP